MKIYLIFILVVTSLSACGGFSSNLDSGDSGDYDFEKDFYDLDERGYEKYMDVGIGSNPRVSVYNKLGGDDEKHSTICKVSDKVANMPNDSIIFELLLITSDLSATRCRVEESFIPHRLTIEPDSDNDNDSLILMFQFKADDEDGNRGKVSNRFIIRMSDLEVLDESLEGSSYGQPTEFLKSY